MENTRLRIPTGRRRTSFLFTIAAKDMNSGLPRTNPASGQGGTLDSGPLDYKSSALTAHRQTRHAHTDYGFHGQLTIRNLIKWTRPLYGCCGSYRRLTIGSLCRNVFERRTLTGSGPFSLLICLDATKFVLLSVFTLKETICPRICSKSRPKSAKTPLPVDVRRSKTPLLRLPFVL